MKFYSGRRSSSTYVCIPCRKVSRKNDSWHFGPMGMSSFICPRCQLPMRCMGTKWSPPKKNNHRAWAALIDGDILWDKKRIANRAKRDKNRRLSVRERFIVERIAKNKKERKKKGLPWAKTGRWKD